MSQPKRYICTRVLGMFEMQDAENGDWIYHSDYAALAAENERLRKAGDAMHRAIKVSDYALDWAIEVWLAAKEGRDAK